MSNALVVYESMFGNTETVAGSVTQGLRLAGVDADVVDVASAPTELPSDIALLVLGAPTHAFSLSRPSTRDSAVAQGADPERTRIGIREWLASVSIDPDHRPALAAFDTRVTKVRWLPKAAGPTTVRLAYKHGLVASVKPEAFLVGDVLGPLVPGELDRARDWGRRLAQIVSEPVGADVTGTA